MHLHVSDESVESDEGSQPCNTSSTMAALPGIANAPTSSCSNPVELAPEKTVDNVGTPAEEWDVSHLELRNLLTQIDSLQKENKDLRDESEKLKVLNMKLQEVILSKTVGEVKFTDVQGYPDANWLLSVSQNARDSDYLFVKELLVRLFPDGIGNATVCGRPSNNPLGRRVRGSDGSDPFPNRVVDKMDPEKVNYIKGKFCIVVLPYFLTSLFVFVFFRTPLRKATKVHGSK